MADLNVKYRLQTFSRLRDLQKDGTLCDLVLISKDGSEFRVHASVIVAASRSFYTLLIQKGSLKKIRLMNISGKSLGLLIRFIYGEHLKCVDELTLLSQTLLQLGMKDLFPFLSAVIKDESFDALSLSKSISHFSSSHEMCGSKQYNRTEECVSSDLPISANQITADNAILSKGTDESKSDIENPSTLVEYDNLNIKSEPKSPEPKDTCESDKFNYPTAVKSGIDSGDHGNQTCRPLRQGSGGSDANQTVKTESAGQCEQTPLTDDSYALQASYHGYQQQSNNYHGNQQQSDGLMPVGLYRNTSLPYNVNNPAPEKPNYLKMADNLHPPCLQSSKCPAENTHSQHVKVCSDSSISTRRTSTGIGQVKNTTFSENRTGKDSVIHPHTPASSMRQTGGSVGVSNEVCNVSGPVTIAAHTGRRPILSNENTEKDRVQCADHIEVKRKRVQVVLRPIDDKGNYALFPASPEPTNSLNDLNVMNTSVSRSLEKIDLETLTKSSSPSPTCRHETKLINSPKFSEMKHESITISRDQSHAIPTKQGSTGKEVPSSARQLSASRLTMESTSSQGNAEPVCALAAKQNIVMSPSGQVVALPQCPVQISEAVPRCKMTVPSMGSQAELNAVYVFPIRKEKDILNVPKIRNILPRTDGAHHDVGNAVKRAKDNDCVFFEPVHDCASKRMKRVHSGEQDEGSSRSPAGKWSATCRPTQTGETAKRGFCDKATAKAERVVENRKRKSTKINVKRSSFKLRRSPSFGDAICDESSDGEGMGDGGVGGVGGGGILFSGSDADLSAVTGTNKTGNVDQDKHVFQSTVQKSDGVNPSLDHLLDVLVLANTERELDIYHGQAEHSCKSPDGGKDTSEVASSKQSKIKIKSTSTRSYQNYRTRRHKRNGGNSASVQQDTMSKYSTVPRRKRRSKKTVLKYVLSPTGVEAKNKTNDPKSQRFLRSVAMGQTSRNDASTLGSHAQMYQESDSPSGDHAPTSQEGDTPSRGQIRSFTEPPSCPRQIECTRGGKETLVTAGSKTQKTGHVLSTIAIQPKKVPSQLVLLQSMVSRQVYGGASPGGCQVSSGALQGTSTSLAGGRQQGLSAMSPITLISGSPQSQVIRLSPQERPAARSGQPVPIAMAPPTSVRAQQNVTQFNPVNNAVPITLTPTTVTAQQNVTQFNPVNNAVPIALTPPKTVRAQQNVTQFNPVNNAVPIAFTPTTVRAQQNVTQFNPVNNAVPIAFTPTTVRAQQNVTQFNPVNNAVPTAGIPLTSYVSSSVLSGSHVISRLTTEQSRPLVPSYTNHPASRTIRMVVPPANFQKIIATRNPQVQLTRLPVTAVSIFPGGQSAPCRVPRQLPPGIRPAIGAPSVVPGQRAPAATQQPTQSRPVVVKPQNPISR